MSRTLWIAATLLAPLAGWAYPIAPQTLWDLTQQAELVVLAHVEAVEQWESVDGDRNSSHVARLRILETWKGLAAKGVAVRFNPNVICPAPASYVEGRRVVAFLSRDGKGWFTVGRSYGTRYPEDVREETELATVVKAALAAQRAKAPPQDGAKNQPPPRATLNWAMLAVKGRATRWDGLYALRSAADPAHAFYDRDRGEDAPLPEETLEQLEAIFVATPSYDETLPQMLRLLQDRKSAAITQAGVDALETVLHNSSAPWWTDEVLDLLAERLAGPKPPPVVPADPLEAEMAHVLRGRGETKEARDERLQSSWDAFKKRHGLEPRLRDDYVRTKHTGTGAQTPL
ncbi:MAG: hypothetical protein AB1938_02375 [Myxococcota bacterium]